MVKLSTSAFLFVILPLALAGPHRLDKRTIKRDEPTLPPGQPSSSKGSQCGTRSCHLSKFTPTFPSGQTALVVPTGQKLVAAGLGVGTQNYTCGAAGTYASTGALAKLYDISCFVSQASTITAGALEAEQSSPEALQTFLSTTLGHTPIFLGDHFFITNPYATTPAILPEFNFVSGVDKDDLLGYAIVNKTGDIPAPTNPTVNVPWLQLTNPDATTPVNSGDLANIVFRIETAGGQPPTSCTVGSAPITVPYAAEYLFYSAS